MCIIFYLLICGICDGLRLVFDEPTYECSSRYEYRNVIKNYAKELQSCAFVRDKFPMCRNDLSVALSIDPPYSLLNSNKEVKGLVSGMLELAVETCCFGCANVKYVSLSDEIGKYFNDGVDVVLPHEGTSKNAEFGAYDYIPFVDVHGAVFLTKESLREPVKVSAHLLTSVLGTWPLFVTAILMALIAGCVVWVLDSWFNEDEFPLRFPRGPFEGFWWAFVSMTTVGYGDRSPKSVCGRVFAVIWIIIGITIFSMYTATLTTALSSEVDENKDDSLYGKYVGVLAGDSVGHSAGVIEHAFIKTFDTLAALLDALQSETVYVIAVDDNVASYYISHFEKQVSGLTLHHRLTISGSAYGILSYNKNITKFIKSFIESNEDNKKAMYEEIRELHKISHQRANDIKPQGKVLFTDRNEFFYVTIGVLAAFGVFVCLVGFVFKYLQRQNKACFDKYIMCQEPRRQKEQNNITVPMHLSKDELQKVFTQELKEFKEKWIKIFLQDTSS